MHLGVCPHAKHKALYNFESWYSSYKVLFSALYNLIVQTKPHPLFRYIYLICYFIIVLFTFLANLINSFLFKGSKCSLFIILNNISLNKI